MAVSESFQRWVIVGHSRRRCRVVDSWLVPQRRQVVGILVPWGEVVLGFAWFRVCRRKCMAVEEGFFQMFRMRFCIALGSMRTSSPLVGRSVGLAQVWSWAVIRWALAALWMLPWQMMRSSESVSRGSGKVRR